MSNDKFDLSGKVAIITGATKGMGAYSAERFAASGADIVISSRNIDELEAKAASLNATYGNGRTIAVAKAGSLSEKSDLQELVDTAVDRFGKLTTLLCSPTILPWLGSSIETPDDIIDKEFLYIFKSRFWISSMAIPHMIAAGGGSLIYIGSGSPFESTTERSVGTCARAAEVQMMKNFAAEFGRHNVRANIVAPGMIDSNGSQKLFDSPSGRERIRKLPMRRGGRPEEIASVAAFLASEASSFTTGAVIPVDGGRLLHAVDGMLTSAYGSANDSADK
jgi:3-oxoacyl-[acyl-carrier protein] reductase